MPRVVVLGCGTGVGKTRVSVALIRELERRGRASLGLKPIESGLAQAAAAHAAAPSSSDAEALQVAGSLRMRLPHPLYGFEAAVSPHLAARETGRSIALQQIADWVTEGERQARASSKRPSADWTVIETAGGVFSPLSPTETNFDLAQRLEPATWLLVAADSLGVLHDVSATWQAMKARGRLPDHLVLSQARKPDASTGSNANELALLGPRAPTAVLRRHHAPEFDLLLDSLLADTRLGDVAARE